MSSTNGVDVFNVDALNKDIKIGERQFTLKPLKVKNFRKIVAIITQSFGELGKLADGSPEETISGLADFILQKNGEIFEIMFEGQAMTRDYVENNMTLPMARKILETAITMNGLDDLYPLLKKINKAGETPSKITAGE